MPEITIATSIIPRNFPLQRSAMDSWLSLGFRVISLNSAEEAEVITRNFPDIPVKIVTRTAVATSGRPFVFFDDVCSALSGECSEVCGIVNSDIFLKADSGFVNFVAETVGDGFLFGSRIDVDSMENLDGEKFIYGFDFFFFNRRIVECFPLSGFCLGVPWWDYWAPFVPLARGVQCRELLSPVAFHVRHETNWSGDLFCDYGMMYARQVLDFIKDTDVVCNITDSSSPAELTVFSFDILQYILKNSGKVVYPSKNEGDGLIEVGRSQYLAMREQAITHHRRVWELNEQIRLAGSLSDPCSSEIDRLRSSLSWRITGPLRWIGGKIR